MAAAGSAVEVRILALEKVLGGLRGEVSRAKLDYRALAEEIREEWMVLAMQGGCTTTLAVTVTVGGAPAGAGLVITARAASGSSATATTDGSGVATFAALRGHTSYTLTGPTSGCESGSQTVALACTPGATTLALALATTPIAVLVAGCGGAALAGATASATLGSFTASGTTDATGHVTLDVGPGGPGTYTIAGSASGYTAGSTTLAVACGQSSSATVNLTQTAFPATFVLSGCGCPLPATTTGTVDVYDAAGTLAASASTDATGHATVLVPRALVGTAWTWTASAPSYQSASGTASAAGYGVVNGISCSWGVATVLMQATPGHYCFGGAQPPGTTAPLPATVQATLSRWSGYGSLAGTTVACPLDLTSTTGSTAVWTSACLPWTPNQGYAGSAIVRITLGMDACVASNVGSTSGSGQFTTYSGGACNPAGQSGGDGGVAAAAASFDPVSFTCGDSGSTSTPPQPGYTVSQ